MRHLSSDILLDQPISIPFFLWNPIEKMWSKIKAYLRKKKARNLNALSKAVGEALGKVTDKDSQGWFASFGYSLI